MAREWREMSWKQIETSREIRLWITRVVFPLAAGAAVIHTTHPDFFPSIGRKVKTKFDDIFKKDDGGKSKKVVTIREDFK